MHVEKLQRKSGLRISSLAALKKNFRAIQPRDLPWLYAELNYCHVHKNKSLAFLGGLHGL